MRAVRTACAAAGMTPMTLRDKTAVVGIGATPYYKRGEALPQTEVVMACKAILAALDDAGVRGRERRGRVAGRGGRREQERAGRGVRHADDAAAGQAPPRRVRGRRRVARA